MNVLKLVQKSVRKDQMRTAFKHALIKQQLAGKLMEVAA